jgi:hypothetical protein
MTAASRLPRTQQGAANLPLAASSVASVAFGYERALRSCESGFSRLLTAIQSRGDR